MHADRRRLLQNALVFGATVALPVVAAGSDSKPSPNDLQARRLDLDSIVVDGLDPSELTDDYLALLKAGGVNVWHQTVGDDFESFAELLKYFDAHLSQIAPAGSVREIRSLHARKIIAHVAGWQSADGLVVSGEPKPTNLRAYHELGLRICGIAYNLANPFGGGCLDPQVGLTRAGRTLVEEIHRARLVLDVAGHTGEKTSFEAIAMSAGIPVICSHTNLRVLNDNPRCSTDKMIEAIARTGGVVGLSAFNDFHARRAIDSQVPRTPQVGLERHLDQYDYLKRLVGVEHIGIGPDFIEGRNKADSMSRGEWNVMAADAYSQQMPWFYVKGFENIGQLPNVVRGLLTRGWSTRELSKVMGENWLRVYERVWGA